MSIEWQVRAPEDSGNESAWMRNTESGATYLGEKFGYEVRTRTVSEGQVR